MATTNRIRSSDVQDRLANNSFTCTTTLPTLLPNYWIPEVPRKGELSQKFHVALKFSSPSDKFSLVNLLRWSPPAQKFLPSGDFSRFILTPIRLLKNQKVLSDSLRAKISKSLSRVERSLFHFELKFLLAFRKGDLLVQRKPTPSPSYSLEYEILPTPTPLPLPLPKPKVPHPDVEKASKTLTAAINWEDYLKRGTCGLKPLKNLTGNRPSCLPANDILLWFSNQMQELSFYKSTEGPDVSICDGSWSVWLKVRKPNCHFETRCFSLPFLPSTSCWERDRRVLALLAFIKSEEVISSGITLPPLPVVNRFGVLSQNETEDSIDDSYPNGWNTSTPVPAPRKEKKVKIGRAHV